MTRRPIRWADPRTLRCYLPDWFDGWLRGHRHARRSDDRWIVYVECVTPSGWRYVVAGEAHTTPLRAYVDLHGNRPEDGLVERVRAALPPGYRADEGYLVRFDATRWDDAERVDFPPPTAKAAASLTSDATGRVRGPVVPPRDLLWFPCVVPAPSRS